MLSTLGTVWYSYFVYLWLTIFITDWHDNKWTMNGNGCGRQQLLPTLKHKNAIFLEEMSK